MKTRVVIFSLFTTTLLAIGVTVTLLFNTAPLTTNTITAFFLSLFVALFGLFFFIFYLWSFMRYRALPPWRSTVTAARWSLLAASFLGLSLLLRSYQLWNLASGLVLLVAFVILDLVLRRKIKQKTSNNE